MVPLSEPNALHLYQEVDMRRFIVRSMAVVTLFVALMDNQARAGVLLLTYDGVTSDNSSLNGVALMPGTAFTIQDVFSDENVIFQPTQGAGIYSSLSITATVGGISYSVMDAIGYAIQLTDPSNLLFPGVYTPALIDETGLHDGSDFGPIYGTSTPTLDAAVVTPTLFSGYIGTHKHSLTFTTDSGLLTLVYDESIGIDTSITAVPEPSTLTLLCIGAAGLAMAGRRRAFRRAPE
jgi:hypothetical protein